MDLFIYPEAATYKDGYGIGVEYAYNRETPKPNDVVVWLSSYEKEDMNHLRDGDYVIPRNKLMTFKSAKKLLCGRHMSELSKQDLLFLKDYNFETIHCDEVIFYNAIRNLFPDKYLRIRFHNCFSRIGVRNSFLKRPIGFKYQYAIKVMTTLEKEIFSDKNVYKIFISDEDRDFYRTTYGIMSDSETWQYSPNILKMKNNRKDIVFSHKLVWFGGVEAHKESSLQWFIAEVYPKIKKEIADLEFHLWGKNTMKFDKTAEAVYAHGFYKGKGMPLNDCLYVNPDIIGGGIKLKLLMLMENGIPFISTPFGFEGYEKSLIDGKYCVVEEESKWAEKILEFLL